MEPGGSAFRNSALLLKPYVLDELPLVIFPKVIILKTFHDLGLLEGQQAAFSRLKSYSMRRIRCSADMALRQLTKSRILVGSILMGLLLVGCSSGKDWRTASRESSGIAPDPDSTREAVLHVYGADAWGWKGWFAIHTWIAVKRTGDMVYTVYDVVGWRGFHGQPVMRFYQDLPDRYWYGEKPRLLKAHRGEGTDALIDAVHRAALAYPWKTTYRAFPGPNSNTFTSWIAKQVPELELALPFSAIGSSYAE